MTTSLTIPNQGPTLTGQDFPALKTDVSDKIQVLSGSNWSDYNPHDPGINFLDASLYALTDLSYRLDFAFEYLLNDEKTLPIKAFFTPSEALSTTPVTQEDYLKVFLDIEGITSVLLERDETIPSLWTIRANIEASVAEDELQVRALCREIRQRFLSQRTLGDDLSAVYTLSPESVSVKLKLALDADADIDTTLAQIFVALDQDITPRAHFYDEDALLDNGISGDLVFYGPLLNRGVIDPTNLPPSEPPATIFSSDLIQIIRAQTGVQTLEDFQIRLNSEDWQDWSLTIPNSQVVSLDVSASLAVLEVRQQGVSVLFDSTQVLAEYEALSTKTDTEIARTANNVSFQGQDRQLTCYQPFQFDLPVHFGLSPEGLSSDAGTAMQRSARQTGGYLLLLEQVLSNHYAQLDKIHSLLGLPQIQHWLPIAEMFDAMLGSAALSDALVARFWQAVADMPATHSSQALADIQYLDELLADDLSWYQSPEFNDLTEVSGSMAQYLRYNQLFSHLLARLNESSIAPNTVKYGQVITPYLEQISKHPMALTGDVLPRLVLLKSALDKALMLIDYPLYGTGRSRGIDVLQAESFAKFSGLELRIKRILGIASQGFRPVALNNREEIHLIEGVQFQYLLGTGASWSAAEARKLYFVMPSWASRFNNTVVQSLVCTTIAQESPVHLEPVILFLNRIDMDIFEPAFYAWRQATSVYPDSYHCPAFVQDDIDTMRMARIEALGRYVFDLLVAAENETDLSTVTPASGVDFPVISVAEIGVDFTIGFKPLPRLLYDPNTVTGIGTTTINPPTDNDASPFVVTIRPPHVLS